MIWRKSIFLLDQASAWPQPGREILAREPAALATFAEGLVEGQGQIDRLSVAPVNCRPVRL